MACKLNRTTNNFGAVNERLGGLIITTDKRKSLAPGFPFPVASPTTAQTSKRANSPKNLNEPSISRRPSGIKSTPGSR